MLSVAPLESKPFETPVVVAVAIPTLSFLSLRIPIYMTSGRYEVNLFHRSRNSRKDRLRLLPWSHEDLYVLVQSRTSTACPPAARFRRQARAPLCPLMNRMVLRPSFDSYGRHRYHETRPLLIQKKSCPFPSLLGKSASIRIILGVLSLLLDLERYYKSSVPNSIVAAIWFTSTTKKSHAYVTVTDGLIIFDHDDPSRASGFHSYHHIDNKSPRAMP
ncbi:hypothetical protein M9H77_35802 [Catharanthus roseus]|uniref:Uncharacterized protein n=2 Tax=Catharanthus roseus TaxID=4058 RepID=A0ACB9ZS76_CATRO|nr:hypothetical protein M9H77_35800 [Catharanthus roseus]KAI5649797.1 hypothetical protein M9H77_35802 [Catharanthus roseus]